MASITLRLKSHHHKPSSNLTFSLLFSSSSSNNNNNNNNGEKPYPFSSYFTEIKSELKQKQSPNFNNVFTPQGSSTPSKLESIDEIRKNLSEFRRRSSVSTPESRPTFQRNVGNPNPNPNIVGQNLVMSFDKIRDSLRNLNARVGEKGKSVNEHMSLNTYRQNLKLRPPMEEQQQQRRGGGVVVGGGHMVIGGSVENLPANVFGREMKEKEGKKGKEGGGKSEEEEDEMELTTLYTKDELGKKLRELRPEGKGKKSGKDDWFSLSELGERLKKLKEIELKNKVDSGIDHFKELRSTIRHLHHKEESNNAPIQSIDILSSPSFMLSPPKENLVEKVKILAAQHFEFQNKWG
ncbi:uncharacterized protein LOC104904487 isoform X2 [Beta vulgaris subsp. vulgaris]|uniref:uncharacterized protein LOC104904487 isoform X2 n=1 Tax=Beta vulgaris subsp. vulgaris TaxID=3555 RepID=UPI00053F5193|nr:uncharacterized protein LOC104904487 isoform X2 [Beta vulgaris subsp. vulgaris]